MQSTTLFKQSTVGRGLKVTSPIIPKSYLIFTPHNQTNKRTTMCMVSFHRETLEEEKQTFFAPSIFNDVIISWAPYYLASKTPDLPWCVDLIFAELHQSVGGRTDHSTQCGRYQVNPQCPIIPCCYSRPQCPHRIH